LLLVTISLALNTGAESTFIVRGNAGKRKWLNGG
jgi:hypothetical protein